MVSSSAQAPSNMTALGPDEGEVVYCDWSSESQSCSAYSEADDAELESCNGHVNNETESFDQIIQGYPLNDVDNASASKTRNGDADGDADAEPGESISQATIMAARSYQQEMFEESMKRNIIVAMDTGSGKTQIAVLRIHAELERTDNDKLVWFLAPTVALCEQQAQVLRSQIPSVQLRVLTSQDNIDAWSSENVWARALENVRIVVATYQVLYDALRLSFVKLRTIALIVFDEAHNCTKKNPGRKLMIDIYRPTKEKGEPVPHILGLTASPSISSKIRDLEALEESLDAVCKTPVLHRDDLLSRVNRPTLNLALYRLGVNGNGDPLLATSSMNSLEAAKEEVKSPTSPPPTMETELDIFTDIIGKRDNAVKEQMSLFCRKSDVVLNEMGAWAADYYVSRTKRQFLDAVDRYEWWLENWQGRDKQRLANNLQTVQTPDSLDEFLSEDLSEKAQVLIKLLHNQATDDHTVGIVFVKERVTVSILAHLVSSHPMTKDLYQVGTMVGVNYFSGKKRDMSEIWRNGHAQADLPAFRSGKLNLLIATSVLEEGIDVPACNLVVCFDPPPNLKSFVQRRGRARKKKSSLVLFLDDSDGRPKDWEALEQLVEKAYDEDERKRLILRQLEAEEEEVTDEDRITSPETEAFVDIDQAKGHLDHFCRVLAKGEFVDGRPQYAIKETGIDGDAPLLQATVRLPSFLPEEVRVATGKSSWKSEKAATKDAAFQAYKAIFEAGLLNSNLLPLIKDGSQLSFDNRVRMVEARELLDPWDAVVGNWRARRLWSYDIALKDDKGMIMSEYTMAIPAEVALQKQVLVYPEGGTTWTLEIGKGKRLLTRHMKRLEAQDHTQVLLRLAYGHRFKWTADHRPQVAIFTAKDAILSNDGIGSRRFDPVLDENDRKGGLIRDPSSGPLVYVDMIPCKPDSELVQHRFLGYDLAPVHVPYLSVTKWSRRRDFLHPCHGKPGSAGTKKPYSRVLPLTWAKVDEIPICHTYFGMLIPSILHEVEVQLRVKTLLEDVLDDVGEPDQPLARMATTARSAHEVVNYERIELLGDSVLKTSTVVNVAALHPTWPEGYLSFLKDKIVSNLRLFEAARDSRVDQYILTRPFTGQKWEPLFVEEILKCKKQHADDEPVRTRKMSSKTLADVVEALIGAYYLEGGYSATLGCIAKLIPDIEWKTMEHCRTILFDSAPANVALPSTLAPAEELLGYKFQKKVLLIQALTHGSRTTDQHGTYERLEFIGDAILDSLVVTRIFDRQPTMPHSAMHTLKTAMVNADFLAFLVLDRHVERPGPAQVVVSLGENGEGDKRVVGTRPSEPVKIPLWRLMRYDSDAIGCELELVRERHAAAGGLGDAIRKALDEGDDYPWALLARLRARKFLSDLFESVLAAIWVDSGSMAACEAFLARFGLLDRFDRMITPGRVRLLHPKEELSRLANREKIHYRVEARLVDGEGVFSCEVTVGDRVVAKVVDGVSREEVKVKVAEKAVKILRDEKNDMVAKS